MSIIFYDGNCKICNSTIFFLKKKTSLDFKPEPVFGGQSNLLTTFNLTNFDVLHSMWLISDSGEKYSGYYAFKYIFINYSKSFWYKFIFSCLKQESSTVFPRIENDRSFTASTTNVPP